MITREVADKALQMLEVDKFGLDDMDKMILSTSSFPPDSQFITIFFASFFFPDITVSRKNFRSFLISSFIISKDFISVKLIDGEEHG